VCLLLPKSDFGLCDENDEIREIARGIVDGASPEACIGDVFQAVSICIKSSSSVRQDIRGLYHRDESIRKRSLAALVFSRFIPEHKDKC
jgi:hypothetical protein